MKNIKEQNRILHFRSGQNLCKKIITCIGLSLAAHSGIIAQNASYNTDNIPVGGNYNAAFGPYALYSVTSGIENVAIGHSVLGYNNADKNSGLGHGALAYNTSGYDNVGIGQRSLFSNTIGYYNTATGGEALYSNINGILNCAYGYQTLWSNSGGSFNAAFGDRALNSNVTGSGNTAIGHIALWLNTTASYNTGLGNSALHNNTSGSRNSAGGAGALSANTTGSCNTAFGYNAMISNTTGDSNTVVGSYANVSTPNLFNATAVGNQAKVNTSNKVRLGSTCVTVIEGQPAFYTGSDGRFKTNLSEEDVKGIEFIKLLRPVVYNFDTKKFEEFLSKNMPDSIKKISMSQDFSSSTALRRTGFIAQEVEKAAKDVNFNFDGVHKPVDENDNYSLAYSQFVVPLVKAVQQQQKMIEDQSKENTDLKSQVTTLQKQMDALLNSKTGSTTGINQANAIGSEGFAMEQNIPNPFNGETTIKYTLPTSVNTAFMAVYDLTGKQITSFPVTEKGNASLTITSEKLAAGIYIYSIVADGKVIDSKRMIVAEK